MIINIHTKQRELTTNKIPKLIGFLSLIAKQNSICICRPRGLKICKQILDRSINQN